MKRNYTFRVNHQKKMKILTLLITFSIVLIGCINSEKISNRVKLGTVNIYKKSHHSFQYLTIVDKARALNFKYPVGYENLAYNGIYGLEITKRDKKNNDLYFLITKNENDTLWFLNLHYKKAGKLSEIDNEDKILFQKIDSFCRANYSFYKMDITKFKYWYLPNK
jgi:hypothetical protein